METPKQQAIKAAYGEWKDIPGYNGMYQASTNGHIRSLDRIVSNGNGLFMKKGVVLKTTLDKNGYLTLNLYNSDKVKKLWKVHRLIAITFISNPENKATVNHLNSLRNDNRVENLEWATFSENNKHAFDYGNQKPMKGDKSWTYGIEPAKHPSAKKVIHLGTGRIYECLLDATKDLGIKYSTALYKVNLHQKGVNDTGLVYIEDLNDIPQNISVKIGTTVFDYELKQKSDWTRIESEEDLPKDKTIDVIINDECYQGYIYEGQGGLFCCVENRYNSTEIAEIIEASYVTHYQPIIKPKPPIF
ncbi:NUMOD4 domain-containing protein [Elizabethkingia meningoseptica]|uniref:NUMOD4 domain-containing protein n=1 Tax=Elizabethkingia meningoseptica TaxID=238 RepID=UPI0038914BD5